MTYGFHNELPAEELLGSNRDAIVVPRSERPPGMENATKYGWSASQRDFLDGTARFRSFQCR